MLEGMEKAAEPLLGLRTFACDIALRADNKMERYARDVYKGQIS